MASGSGGVHCDDLWFGSHGDLGAGVAGCDTGGLGVGRCRLGDHRFGALAGGLVALHGLARQGARTADVAATSESEERNRAENDDDSDGYGDDCCSTHDWGVSFRNLTIRRTGLRPTVGRS